MRRYFFETTTALPAARLYRAIADINAWPEWDKDLEHTALAGPADPGCRFLLKPKGGPKVQMEVEAADPPHRFADISKLPLARMRTVHEFMENDDGTSIKVTIEVWGPLACLWDRVVARKQAMNAEAQTRRFLDYVAMQP